MKGECHALSMSWDCSNCMTLSRVACCYFFPFVVVNIMLFLFMLILLVYNAIVVTLALVGSNLTLGTALVTLGKLLTPHLPCTCGSSLRRRT